MRSRCRDLLCFILVCHIIWFSAGIGCYDCGVSHAPHVCYRCCLRLTSSVSLMRPPTTTTSNFLESPLSNFGTVITDGRRQANSARVFFMWGRLWTAVKIPPENNLEDTQKQSHLRRHRHDSPRRQRTKRGHGNAFVVSLSCGAYFSQ